MRKKRDKKYVPKPVYANCLDWALAGATLLSDQQKSEIREPVKKESVTLKQGKLDRDGWNMIANALNLAEALIFYQIATNLSGVIEAGQKALMHIGIRMYSTGKATCYSQELSDIDEALNIYRIQLDNCTQGEFSRACKRVKEQHRNGCMKEMKKVFEML